MKRRDFLENTILGTAGLSLGASCVLPLSCKGANDKVVLGLIGSGGRGLDNIIACCRENAGAEVKTVCDVSDKAAENAAAEIEKQLGYRPKTVKNMKYVFDDRDIDAVYIATPDHWHALATIWACQAKKDVYVEKTPGACVWEGRKMLDAAKKYKRIIQVGYQNRSGLYNTEARDYIQSGNLGQVVHIRIYNMLRQNKWAPVPDSEIPAGLDWNEWLGPAPSRPYNQSVHRGWHYFWDYSPGTLNDASHQLDLFRMVMGDPGCPESIYAWGGNHIQSLGCETPEVQSVTYDYGKYTVTCESGNCTDYMSKTPNDIRMDSRRFPEWKTNGTRIEIYGTSGVMYLGRQGGGWQVFGPREEIVAQSGGIHSEKEHHINFIECIRSRKQPNANLEQSHLSALLVHSANIAYRTGNKQLLYDEQNEKFTDNDEANKLLRVSYREKYTIPEKI
jgi:predicted dehydrogenase